MVRSRGAVTDRPWGVTLATLDTQGFTGLLTMTADGKEYSISFDLGRIVGATSPLASDAAVRMALTNHLVSSSQASELNRRIVAAKDRDELEVLAELASLTPVHVAKLRHRLVAQRAARTFALDNGTYVADGRIAMPPGADLDTREVIYLGARRILSEQRLALEVRTLGSVFTIKPDALSSLEQFGFGSEERPVIQSLRAGAGLPQLEAAHRDLDPRMVQAIVYALVSCGACDADRSSATGGVVEYATDPEATARPAPPPPGATYFVARTPTNPEMTQPSDPAMSRTETGEPIVSLPPSFDPTGFRGEPVVPRTATPRPGAANPMYRAPGQPTIPRGARGGRPEKLVNPPPPPVAAVEMTARTRTADGIPATPAGDAFRRGENALRRDDPAEAVIELGRACALDPNNVDFHAMLGWAQFCAARDKVTIAPETRKSLERAIQRSAKPTQARFLLGRVERMLGRDREALRHFKEVVDTSTQHADAAAEIRAIEARLATSPGKR